ncbi:hypothetical protein [Dickeya lacustris]|uniref:Uncharacterized protein n=1 Tax=Dickeya lacustris TaxID=2259638 RepID=A0ABY8G417_9GAMM|nr:hypothetical protein [Dickeya lacustris]WFN54678.1 hypothetical protein O1Q98_13515 [Dickeya lacustris]
MTQKHHYLTARDIAPGHGRPFDRSAQKSPGWGQVSATALAHYRQQAGFPAHPAG